MRGRGKGVPALPAGRVLRSNPESWRHGTTQSDDGRPGPSGSGLTAPRFGLVRAVHGPEPSTQPSGTTCWPPDNSMEPTRPAAVSSFQTRIEELPGRLFARPFTLGKHLHPRSAHLPAPNLRWRSLCIRSRRVCSRLTRNTRMGRVGCRQGTCRIYECLCELPAPGGLHTCPATPAPLRSRCGKMGCVVGLV
jgi:hypothetical protein